MYKVDEENYSVIKTEEQKWEKIQKYATANEVASTFWRCDRFLLRKYSEWRLIDDLGYSVTLYLNATYIGTL